MGQCIGVVNQKGGSGKSSTAVALCYWLALKQKRQTLLVDADAQRSSSMWLSAMPEAVSYKIISDADSLIEKVNTLLQEFEYVVIDGPGSLAEVTRAIVLLADIAIIPCQPTGLDLESASDTVRLISQARLIRKGMPHSVAFLSRAVKGTRLKEEARAVLNELPGVKVLKTVIHQRQVIADAVGEQATVWTTRDRAATDAAREYHNLFTEVLQCLENP